MTAKEKAIELVDKMYHYQWREKERAKECALICVYEVLHSHVNQYGVNSKKTLFYLKVKEEIEKL